VCDEGLAAFDINYNQEAQTLVELVDIQSQAFLQSVLAATSVAESVHPILE